MKYFKTGSGQWHHLEQKHGEDKSEMWKCGSCGKTFHKDSEIAEIVDH